MIISDIHPGASQNHVEISNTENNTSTLKTFWLFISVYHSLLVTTCLTLLLKSRHFQIHFFTSTLTPPTSPTTPTSVYLSAHLLLFSRVDLDMFAEGAGICVALGAAGDLTGVRLLRGGEDKNTHRCLQSVKHTGHRLAIRKDGAFER